MAWANVLLKTVSKSTLCQLFCWVNAMLLSHQENEKRRKGAKCDIRFFQRTSGYGEARIFVLFSEFTSGKAVKMRKVFVHKFYAYLCINICVWTICGLFNNIYEIGSEVGPGQKEDKYGFGRFFQ